VQHLHAHFNVKFIVVCQTITRAVCPQSNPFYNDCVALLNQYLSVALETLPFAEFWRHKGLRKPKFQYCVRKVCTSITKGNILSIGVTGEPFYALLGTFCTR